MAQPAAKGYFPMTQTLRSDALVHYRPCAIGEYYNFYTNARDSCIECNGGYQFYDNPFNLITGCKSCPAAARTCYSDQIILYPKTWRWGHFATTILECPLEGCIGGNLTGQASCRLGYHGPVCGVCDAGYFTKQFTCLPCSKQAFMNTNTIVIIVVFFVAITGSVTLEVRRWMRANEKPAIEYFKRFFKIDDKREIKEEEETAHDRKEKARIRAWMVRLKILVATYQVILNVPIIFNIKMGPLFQMLASIMAFLNLDILQIFPLQCVQPFRYIENMISGTISPVGVVVALFLMYLVQRIHIMTKEPNRIKRRDKMKKLLVRYFTLFVAFTYMILPGISMKIFKTFECQDIDPNNEATDPNAPHIFLRVDYAVDCTTAYYRFGWTWALVMVGIYPVGITSFNFYLVWANRKEVRARMERMSMMRDLDNMCDATPDEIEAYIKNVMRKKNKGTIITNTAFVDGIQFLWSSYRPEMWFWEVVETTRRLMCASVMSIVMSGTPSQCCFAVLVSIAYVKLYTSFKPYFESFDNVMAEFGHYQIFFTFFGVYVMRQQSIGDADNGVYYFLDVMVVLCNFLVAGAFFYTLAGEFVAYRKRLMRVRMGLPPDEVVSVYKPRPRSLEEDMELILSCIKRSPKVLESMGLALEKKNLAVGGRRAGIEMSANSLSALLKANAKRRDNVVGIDHAKLQEMMLANAKKRKSVKGMPSAADMAALQEYEASSSSSERDSSSSSSGSSSGSGSGSGSGSSSGSGSGSGSDSKKSGSKSGSGSGSGSASDAGDAPPTAKKADTGDKGGSKKGNAGPPFPESRLASRVHVPRYSDSDDDSDDDSTPPTDSRPTTAASITFKAPQYSDDSDDSGNGQVRPPSHTFKAPEYSESDSGSGSGSGSNPGSAGSDTYTGVVAGSAPVIRQPVRSGAAGARKPPSGQDHVKINIRPSFDV